MTPATQRDVIYDTVCGDAELASGDNGSRVVISDKEATRIMQAFDDIRECLQEGTSVAFEWNRSLYTVSDKSSIALTRNRECSTLRADIVVYLKTNAIRLTYSVYKHHRNKRWYIQTIANPTSLVSGNNAFPIDINTDKQTVYQDAFRLFRAPFDFLFAMLDITPSKQLSTDISRGNIDMSNAQFALYLRSENKAADLHVLKHLYIRVSITTHNHIGNYLNLEPHTDPDMLDYSVLLRKRSKDGVGKKTSIFSVGIYDKIAQLRAKGKDSILSTEQRAFLDTVLRFDITFHKPQLESMIKQAKKVVKQFSKTYDLDFPNLNRFMESKDVSAYMIARAMSILTWNYDTDTESITRGKFSDYLIQEILYGHMCLDSLLAGPLLEADQKLLTATELKMYSYWKEYTGNNFLMDYTDFIYGAGKHSAPTKEVYATKNSLRDFNIAVVLPYKMLVELKALDGIYGLSFKELERITSDDTSDVEVRKLMQKGSQRIKDARSLVLIDTNNAVTAQPSATLYLED